MTWRALVSELRVGGALPMEFCVFTHDLHDGGDEWLRIGMHVPCLKTGVPITISKAVPLPVYSDTAAEFLRQTIHWFYRHEADEQIRIGGMAIFEPTQDHGPW